MKHLISLKEAKELTKNYRGKREKMLKDDVPNRKKALPFCETFDKEVFRAFMDDEKCKSLRMYFGMDKEDLVKLVIVGVDENGNDILQSQSADDEIIALGDIIEDGDRCPDYCPPPSTLNTDGTI